MDENDEIRWLLAAPHLQERFDGRQPTFRDLCEALLEFGQPKFWMQAGCSWCEVPLAYGEGEDPRVCRVVVRHPANPAAAGLKCLLRLLENAEIQSLDCAQELMVFLAERFD